MVDASGIAAVSKEKVAGDHPINKLASGAKYPKAKVKIKIKGTPEQAKSAINALADK